MLGSGRIQFRTDGSEACRIDSSQNLLVGTTINDGQSIGAGSQDGIVLAGESQYIQRSDNANLWLSKPSGATNSEYIKFYSNSALVGSIGTEGGDLTIGTGDVGLKFNDGASLISPWDTTANAPEDGLFDLGYENGRFRDLYLSGGAYLGGTAAANKLDDYEEGTFTVTFASGVTSPTYVIQDGSYVKIGKLVTFQIRIELSAGTANGSHIKIGGLPFTSTSASSYGGAFFNYSQGFITDIGARTMHIGASATLISFYKTDGGQLAGTEVDDLTSTLLINGQYEVS
jgi:hypothetical protein